MLLLLKSATTYHMPRLSDSFNKIVFELKKCINTGGHVFSNEYLIVDL